MLWVVQAVLSVIEIAGGFLWGDLFVREIHQKPHKRIKLLAGVLIISVLTIYQRYWSMYSRWYLLICIALCSMVGCWVYGKNLRYCFAVASYYETVYCGDIFLGILIGQILNDPDFMHEQQFSFTPWRIVIYWVIRGIFGILLCFLYTNKNKLKTHLRLSGNWWYLVPIFEHIILRNCDIILVQGQQELAVSNWMFSLVLYSISILAFGFYHIYRMKKSLAELVEMQRNLYVQSYENIEKRRFERERELHDFKNHLLVMKRMLQEGTYKKLEEYMDNLYQPFTSKEDAAGIPLIDYVISVKKGEAESKRITVQVKCLNLQPVNNIQEMDWAALLGNLWDNAIESCERCPDPGMIHFGILQKGNILSIHMENSCLPLTQKMGLRTMKEEQDRHGIGMKSIQYIVDKYNGTLNWECTDCIFQIQITMYL